MQQNRRLSAEHFAEYSRNAKKGLKRLNILTHPTFERPSIYLPTQIRLGTLQSAQNMMHKRILKKEEEAIFGEKY